MAQQELPPSESNGELVTTKHTSNYHTNNHHHSPSKSSSPSAALHNNSSGNNNVKTTTTTQKSPSIKKRKRFEETIIDGFSIAAFKTWEDLQDELNERSSSLSNNTATAAAADSASGNSYDHNVVKKAGSKSRHKSSSSSSKAMASLDANCPVTNTYGAPTTTTNVATTTTISSGHNNHKDSPKKKKKKDKIRKSPSHSPDHHPKEKRNKTSSSDKTTLKKALEAKELAEKRLSILQKKLELEQSKNRSTSHLDSSDLDQNQKTTSIVPEHYSNVRNPTELHNHHHNQNMRKDDMTNSNNSNNNSLGHDQIKEQLSYQLNAPKPAPYSPFHITSHSQRTKTTIQQPTHTPPLMHHNSPAAHNISQSHHQSSPTKHQHPPTSNLLQPPNQHHRTTPPPQSNLREPYPPRTPPISSQSSSYQQQRPPLYHHSQSQTATHPMIHPHNQQLHHNPLHPYSSQPTNPMMSSMGLGPMASPYSCPSICITDTISRQTSIIPPLGAALEQSTQQTSTRYGHHPAMLAHPSSHLTPTGHSMFYPMPQTPTERSFMEFVRSYPAPNHMNYPSLMNSLIPPSPLQAGPVGPAPPTPLQTPASTHLTNPQNFTANPYGFDRSWPPRLSLDHRAVNRYHNSIYNPTNLMVERPYASYASVKPPPSHFNMFQPPF